jgi:hypothetical protein
VWLAAATFAAWVPCSAIGEDAPRAARLLADSETADAREPYVVSRMVIVTLAAPLGGFVVTVGGALVGFLLDAALMHSFPVIAPFAGLAGYVVGTGWAAALLGWSLEGSGTFGAAVLGSALGSGAAIAGLLAAFNALARAGIAPPSALAPALVVGALVLPALAASVAFEISHDFARRHLHVQAEVHPTVLLDGARRPAIGAALSAEF